MIRNIISFFLLIITFSTLHAQKYDIGAVAGLSTSQIYGDSWSGYNQFGAHLGGYLTWNFNSKFSGHTELRINQKGSRSESDPEGMSSEYYKSRLNYLELPLALQYHHNKKLSFDAGLCAGYLINAKENTNGYKFHKAYPEFSMFDLAFCSGIYFNISDRYSIGLRHTISMLAVRNTIENSVSNLYYISGPQYNDAILISLGYSIVTSK